MSRQARQRAESLLFYCLLAVVVLTSLFPILWVFLTSVKSRFDAFAMPPKWIFTPTLGNYIEVFRETALLKNLVNSSIIATLATLVAMLVGVPAAYSYSRFHFLGRDLIYFAVLLVRMVPPIALALPLFILFQRFQLIDTHYGLALAYTSFTTPLAVWLLAGFFADVPEELEDAARIDGCSRLGALVRVVLPLAAPGLAATAIICFVAAWNEFLYAVILAGRHTQTLPVAIQGFVTNRGINWGRLTAGGFLILLPVLLFAMVAQKRLVRGLTGGAVKG
ncbi:MAG: carbohydrate ABC transporter permease [Deinococcus sp.]|nr:carbohydrate ABC transporter permease [Deinococcus sp.]